MPINARRRLLALFFLMLFMLACAIPSINQQILLRTPLPVFRTATAPFNQPTATQKIPLIPTPVYLIDAPFQVREPVTYQRNYAVPEQECIWMGVAGQVFDRSGSPLEKYVVVIEGMLKETSIEAIGLTGTTDAYGQHSYEIQLSYLPVNSAQTLSIVIYDLNGVQLTNVYRFNTYADCTRNLIRIDFQQN